MMTGRSGVHAASMTASRMPLTAFLKRPLASRCDVIPSPKMSQSSPQAHESQRT